MTANAAILVVDDTPADRMFLAKALTAEGYQVSSVENGDVALASVAARPPDLILLDVLMPGIDGFEVCRRLKAREESRDIPVIFISASGASEKRAGGLRLGAVDFISKPIHLEEMLARVLTHLELRRSRSAALERAVEAVEAARLLQTANAALQSEIAGRRQAQAALLASEIRYRRLFESAKDGLLILDADTGMIMDVNPFLVELLAFSREAFLGKKVWELRFFKDVVANQARFVELQQKEFVHYEDTALEASDGRRIDVEFVSNVYLVNDAKVIQCNIRDVTKRRRTEDALGASRQLIEGIIDAIPARVFWKDKDLLYLGCNTAFAHDAGFAEPKDVVGKDDYQMAWRDHAERYRSDDRKVIETGHAKLHVEEPGTSPDGNSITLLTSKVPLRSSAGDIRGVLGTYLDISERQRAGEALRASEARYRRLFESAQDGILILDAETGMVVDVNPFLVELLGLSRETFLGKKVWDLGPLKDTIATQAHFGELQQKTYVRYENMALPTSDGRSIDVEFVSNLYLVNDTKLIQCNIRDVTRRVRALESNARLATAVEQAAEAVVITDTAGSIVYANPAFFGTTGYTREETLGQNPRILKSGKQDPEFYRHMWSVLSRGEVWRGRITNRKKDGTFFDEDASISSVRDAAGRVVNYVAVKHDVTNQTLLERQLLQAQKMEAIGRLAGGVAHDFNNLLGVITGYGEIVHRRLSDEDPLKGKVEQILKAGERAAELTRQLLAFGRKQVLQPKVLDLNAVVSSMQKMLPRVIGEDVELMTLLEPHLGSVNADPGQIDQILMNLAVNARDAMPEGGRITIETHNADLDESYVATHAPARTGPHVMFAVTDTGSGMDAATQARIFEPFFTTKEVGKGTGLGLATVYGIVKQSDGFVWVYSEVGVGTTFKIYLPRVDEEAQPGRAEGPGPLLRGTETVLLVEDEASLREILKEVLDGNGYSVLVARDGAEALQMAAAHPGPIQLMVTDVIMPGMTGPTTADLVAQTRPDVKVLFISGYSDEAVTRHGLVGPRKAFLSKPFGPEALLRKVRESLDAG